jgi:hypothetical protein
VIGFTILLADKAPQQRGQYRHGRNAGNYFWTNRISRTDIADFILK